MFDNLRNILDFDDLLFEKRNRDYGAFQLRKRYNSVVIACIFVASVVASSAVLFPFLSLSHKDHVLRGGGNYIQVKMENFEPPMDEFVLPPPPPPAEASHLQEIVKYVPPVIVDSVLPIDEPLPITDEVLGQSSVDNKDAAVTGSGEDLSSGQEGGDTDEPFFLVEVMPAFKGGDINKFREWVQKRTNYPQSAIDNKIQGKVFLTFIIERDGSVSNVTVVKSIDPLIDNEAVKAIQASPKWTPGLQRGQPVRVRYSMGLNFLL
jgi:periplasmic protein TonB